MQDIMIIESSGAKWSKGGVRMFSGQSNHTLDEKGRLIIPSRYRSSIGELFYLLRSVQGDACIWIMPEEGYNNLILGLNERIEKTDTKAQRWLKRILATSFSCESEKQGRVLIPQVLREAIGLKGNEVTLVGAIDHVEIWSNEEWAALNSFDFMEDTLFVNSKYGV